VEYKAWTTASNAVVCTNPICLPPRTEEYVDVCLTQNHATKLFIVEGMEKAKDRGIFVAPVYVKRDTLLGVAESIQETEYTADCNIVSEGEEDIDWLKDVSIGPLAPEKQNQLGQTN